MIITIMGSKGIRQYDLSRYPKTLIIVIVATTPLLLMGIGMGIGTLFSSPATLSRMQDAPPPSSAPTAEHLQVSAELRQRVQQLQQQLDTMRQDHQASEKQITELKAKLQETQERLRLSQALTSHAKRKHPSPHTSFPKEYAVQVDDYHRFAHHPMVIDWLKLSHNLAHGYPTTLHPNKQKHAHTKAHHTPRPATMLPSQTWGTAKTFRAKGRTLPHSSPFDRLYRRQSTVQRVARSQLGKHYVWGAIGPKTFDCSGFTSYVYRKAGLNIPRTSRNQSKYGTRISRRNLKPGDLIFFDTSHAHRGYVNHVGIYLGNDRFIHASSARRRVTITSLNKAFYSRRFKWGRRITN